MKAFSFFSAMALTLTLSVSTVQAATDVYNVTGISSGQVLNMRSGAGTGYATTASIPADGQGIVTTGEQKKVNGTTWAKVYWKGIGGWVNKSYLLPEGQKAAVPQAKPAAPAVKKPNTNVTPRVKPTTPAATKPNTGMILRAKPATPAVTYPKVVVPPVKIPSYITLPKSGIKH